MIDAKLQLSLALKSRKYFVTSLKQCKHKNNEKSIYSNRTVTYSNKTVTYFSRRVIYSNRTILASIEQPPTPKTANPESTFPHKFVIITVL